MSDEKTASGVDLITGLPFVGILPDPPPRYAASVASFVPVVVGQRICFVRPPKNPNKDRTWRPPNRYVQVVGPPREES